MCTLYAVCSIWCCLHVTSVYYLYLYTHIVSATCICYLYLYTHIVSICYVHMLPTFVCYLHVLDTVLLHRMHLDMFAHIPHAHSRSPEDVCVQPSTVAAAATAVSADDQVRVPVSPTQYACHMSSTASCSAARSALLSFSVTAARLLASERAPCQTVVTCDASAVSCSLLRV